MQNSKGFTQQVTYVTYDDVWAVINHWNIPLEWNTGMAIIKHKQVDSFAYLNLLHQSFVHSHYTCRSAAGRGIKELGKTSKKSVTQ